MRILFLILFLIFYCKQDFAQDKIFTIQDAVVGQWRQYYPKQVKGLKWKGESDFFTYVENNELISEDAKTGKKKKTILSLEKLNEILKENKIESMSHFPYYSYDWQSENIIKFSLANRIFIYDLENKKTIANISYDEKGKNFDFCEENNKIAYTIDNNLLMIDEKNEIISITSERGENIVSGQTIARSEFGIEKGTFWSPKGNYLAFYQKNENMVSDYPIVNVDERVAKLENIKYPMAGMKSEETNLGIFDCNKKQSLFLSGREEKESYLTNIAWTLDEKFILIAVLNRKQNHMKLQKYNVKTLKVEKTLFEEKNEKYVEPIHPAIFLKTKPNQFLWQTRKDGYNHIYLYDLEGNLIKQLTKGKWEVTNILGFDNEEKYLFFQATKESPIERHLYKLDMKKGDIEKITIENGTHKTQISKNGKFVLDTYSNTKVPNSVNILNVKKSKLIRNILTAKDPYTEHKMGEMSIGTIKAADGKTDLYYRLVKPADFDPSKKYPTIVYVYGGPHAQMINNSWLADISLWQFYMAQKGYVMFTLDNRGSYNRGLEFENVIHRQLGVNEVADQMKGIDFLKTLEYVDEEKIGVHGWSYGGFMTTSLMLHYPETFKVGVAGGPVIDWKYYEIMYGERYMDTPDENPEGYKKANLKNYVKNLEGRLLIIHGAIDPTVVWQHSLTFVRECVKNNVLLDYFPYPRHEHNVRGMDRIHLMKKITQYFDDFLK